MHHLPLHLVPKYESDPYEHGDAFAANSGRVALWTRDVTSRRIDRCRGLVKEAKPSSEISLNWVRCSLDSVINGYIETRRVDRMSESQLTAVLLVQNASLLGQSKNNR